MITIGFYQGNPWRSCKILDRHGTLTVGAYAREGEGGGRGSGEGEGGEGETYLVELVGELVPK